MGISVERSCVCGKRSVINAKILNTEYDNRLPPHVGSVFDESEPFFFVLDYCIDYSESGKGDFFTLHIANLVGLEQIQESFYKTLFVVRGKFDVNQFIQYSKIAIESIDAEDSIDLLLKLRNIFQWEFEPSILNEHFFRLVRP